MYRPEVKLNAVLHVHLKRGHRHCFDLVDPNAATLRHWLDDPLVEILTTDDDVYVEVIDVDETDLIVRKDGDVMVLH